MSHRMCAFGKTPIQIARIIRKGVWMECKVYGMADSKSKTSEKKKLSNGQGTPDPSMISKEIIHIDKKDEEEELFEYISHSWLQFAEGRPESGAETNLTPLDKLIDPPSFAEEITNKNLKQRLKKRPSNKASLLSGDKTVALGKGYVVYGNEALSPDLKDFKPFDLDSFAKSSRQVAHPPLGTIGDMSERCRNGNKHVRPSAE